MDGGRLMDNRHKLKEERFRLDKRKLFHNEDSQAMKAAVQGGCAFKVFKSRLDKVPQAPWSDVLSDPALGRRLH